MGLFDFFKSKKNEGDGAIDLLKIYSKMYENGLDVDELPNSIGEFGLEVTNPIPTHTAMGSTTYLSKLKTADGGPIKFSRIGSFGASNYPDTPVDGYRIETIDGQKLPNLYLCMYHKRNSNKAPKGFSL